MVEVERLQGLRKMQRSYRNCCYEKDKIMDEEKT